MSSPSPFKIDKGVPIPPRRGRVTKDQWTIWPFDEMQVTDSFFVGQITKADSARRAALDYEAQYRGVKFTTRVFEIDPIYQMPGVRVWRVR